MSTFLPLLRYCDDEPENAAPGSADVQEPVPERPAESVPEKRPANQHKPEAPCGTPGGPVSILRKNSRTSQDWREDGDSAAADTVAVSAGPGAPKRRVSFNLPTSVNRHGPAELPPPGNGYSWGTGAGSCPAPATVIISSDDWRDYLDPARWPREKSSSAHGSRTGGRDGKKGRGQKDRVHQGQPITGHHSSSYSQGGGIVVGDPADAVVIDARGYSTVKGAAPAVNSKWLLDVSDAAQGSGGQGQGKKGKGKKVREGKAGKGGKANLDAGERVVEAGLAVHKCSERGTDGGESAGGEKQRRQPRTPSEGGQEQGQQHMDAQQQGQQQQQQQNGQQNGQPGRSRRSAGEAIVDVARRVYLLQMRWLEEACVGEHELELGTRVFTPAQFDDVSLERHLAGRCGYPGCANPVAPPKAGPQPRYRISLKDKAVYDRSRAARYCRPRCAVLAAEYTRVLEAMPPQDMPAAFRRLDALIASQGVTQGVVAAVGDCGTVSTPVAVEAAASPPLDEKGEEASPDVLASSSGNLPSSAAATSRALPQGLPVSTSSAPSLSPVSAVSSSAAASSAAAAIVDLVVKERDTRVFQGGLPSAGARGARGSWASSAVEGYVPACESRLAPATSLPLPALPASSSAPSSISSGARALDTNTQADETHGGSGDDDDDEGDDRINAAGSCCGGDGGGSDDKRQRYRQQKREQRRKHKSKQSAREVRAQQFKDRCVQAAAQADTEQADVANRGERNLPAGHIASESEGHGAEDSDRDGSAEPAAPTVGHSGAGDGAATAATDTGGEGAAVNTSVLGTVRPSGVDGAAAPLTPAACVAVDGAIRGDDASAGASVHSRDVVVEPSNGRGGDLLLRAVRGHSRDAPMGGGGTRDARAGPSLNQARDAVASWDAVASGGSGRDVVEPVGIGNGTCPPEARPSTGAISVVGSASEPVTADTPGRPTGVRPVVGPAAEPSADDKAGALSGPPWKPGEEDVAAAASVASGGDDQRPKGQLVTSSQATPNGAVVSNHPVKPKGCLNGAKPGPMPEDGLVYDLAQWQDEGNEDSDDEEGAEEWDYEDREEDVDYESDEGLLPAMSQREWQLRRHRGPSAVTLGA
eukprot:jgi/Mesvir1/9053/Mv21330-RA.2